MPVANLSPQDARFISNIDPRPEARAEVSVMAAGPQATTLIANQGVVAGQTMNTIFDSYFEPFPNSQGYGSGTIQAHWKIGNQTGDSVPVKASGWWGYGTVLPVEVPPDVEGPLSVTFTERRIDGTELKHPAEYQVDVLPANAPIIKFGEDWYNEVSAPLVAGGAFKVAYDVDRLKKQLQIEPGKQAQIGVFVSFDGAYPQERAILYQDATGEHVDMPAFRIPPGTKDVRLWFAGGTNSPRVGRHGDDSRRYDSNWANDYHFSVRQ
jgi:hypothetical protein